MRLTTKDKDQFGNAIRVTQLQKEATHLQVHSKCAVGNQPVFTDLGYIKTIALNRPKHPQMTIAKDITLQEYLSLTLDPMSDRFPFAVEDPMNPQTRIRMDIPLSLSSGSYTLNTHESYEIDITLNDFGDRPTSSAQIEEDLTDAERTATAVHKIYGNAGDPNVMPMLPKIVTEQINQGSEQQKVNLMVEGSADMYQKANRILINRDGLSKFMVKYIGSDRYKEFEGEEMDKFYQDTYNFSAKSLRLELGDDFRDMTYFILDLKKVDSIMVDTTDQPLKYRLLTTQYPS